MRADTLDYHLPDRLIATRPAEPRDAARLMVCHRDTGRIDHRHVRDLPGLGVLKAGDLMIANRTRVLPAHFHAIRTATAGQVRGLYLQADDGQHLQVMLETRGKLRPGEHIAFTTPPHDTTPNQAPETAALELTRSLGGGRWQARYLGDEPVPSLLSRIGQPPLPPYIQKARKARDEPGITADDVQRYNTVFADVPGSVAAPTAGLHFTDELLARLARLGIHRRHVTLHVGLGTFMPVRADTLDEHDIHEEWLQVPADTLAHLARTREAGGRTLVVGTTSVRAIESLPEPIVSIEGDYTASTRLFIYPGAAFRYRFTDMLLTNFHLPRSTLLAMVAALPGVGIDRLHAWYAEAIAHEYRFYSYGDAMLIV
ncbi:tRNA preQ1(34) S-adenosylmethionine ribosyltransferase-isomerase QueA [Phycisphaerales bacterium AB-hyl4]|uniref:S-adenosylmethionine:tRNA ribosyltransferase-isomerase n=1 Tax=Natronomicrosphaera hydrolytica TaxID=3242702 RepID=A0ABV4UC61_9BACT